MSNECAHGEDGFYCDACADTDKIAALALAAANAKEQDLRGRLRVALSTVQSLAILMGARASEAYATKALAVLEEEQD